MLTLRPATYVETISRSFLLSLGFDHVVTEFFVSTAIGAFAVLMTMIVLGAGIPRRRRVTLPQSTNVMTQRTRCLPARRD